jgi:antitoxin PrlF
VAPGQKIEVDKLPDGRIEVKAARATGSIDDFIGLLAGKTKKVASIEEIDRAAAAGWVREE